MRWNGIATLRTTMAFRVGVITAGALVWLGVAGFAQQSSNGIEGCVGADRAPRMIGKGESCQPGERRLLFFSLKVIDKATKKPLANTAVRIFKAAELDRPICKRGPCPGEGVDWSGKTDDQGIVLVPPYTILSASELGGAILTAAGYSGSMDMGGDLKKIADGSWIIALKDKSLSSTNPEKEIPKWLAQRIKDEKASPPANPPAQVMRYTYREQTVYYIPPRCCDIPSRLYDEDGKLMCSPDGGETGGGDGGCANFFKKRKDALVIWKDMRGRQKFVRK